MLKQLARTAATRVAPRWTAWAVEQSKQRRLVAQAQALQQTCSAAASLGAIVDEVLASHAFRPSQKRSEILQLMELLRADPPARMCEIGAARGGTLALFSHVVAPDARILSVDISYTPRQLKACPHLARPTQRATCLKADSHAVETVGAVRQWLGSDSLDFLFIDGDHTLAGVTRDFTLYSPLVREGGLIAFHDIVPDFATRFGTVTKNQAGQVPEYWRTLAAPGTRTQEFIDDPNQDGFGIGVLWPARQG